MDSTSNIVEKVVEPNNETKDVHADVDNDKSAEKLLDSTIDTDQSVILTCNKNDDELIIDESASKECKSEENITSGEAVYSAPSAATIIDKGLIPTGSFEDNTNDGINESSSAATIIDKGLIPTGSFEDNTNDGINGSSYIESENQTVEDLSMKPSLSIIQENSLANIKINSINTDSEATPKDNIIDDTNIVSASNDEEVPAQEDEGEHVRSIEDGKLHDCSESLTEKNPNEPTTISPDLFSECTKSEIVTSTNPVNKLEELSENVKCKNEELFHKLLEESTNQSNNFNSQIRESGRVGLSDQNEFNNQILEIISDIDINIKAQEKITQLKEQELKLIQKQNDLANQIQQQQILAQKLSAQNQQTQYPSGKLDLLSRQQNERSISTSGLNEDAALKEATNVSKTVDLRKIFTPATDTNEILPKNRKLYASSAFYSPSLHPTVEDQVELARRISHSLSDISNQTSKGQSMYVNRKKRSDKWVHEGSSQDHQQHQQRATISQNIFPAYSDAGKHRVQLNIHQNQLIEKYSRPGLQVVQSPWEAALETGSASSAFLEENKSQCALRTAISPIQYSQCASKDLTDSLEPFGASLEPTHFRPQKNYTNIIASPPQSFNVPSNPQRELAYTPSVAQGWGGRTVELPKGLYVPKEISLSSYVAPPQQYGGYNKHFESQRSLSGSLPKSTTKLLANDDIKKSSLAPEFKIRFNTVPPTEQLHSPCSYKKKPNGVENFSPQVNFSPSPLSFNKLAMYEQPDQRNMKITSNASPTQYGITSFEHVSGSPSSIGSVESPRHMLPTGSLRCGPLTTGSDSPLSIRGQSFNKCARGWGTTPDKQERYRLPLEGNLPFSDF
ncbi:uncharacterized protein LOC108102351 isoform X14 [Drosophila eugracilis]|uniref:uncharacterized protein LOC108102351 isoform X14 n=1 Tax=Drosophila eugracilis TaxID=29029 RepID=UPI0007E7DB07|nr:uncharacterized protein LOC108102351 isoform X14 [Drosophila eugracilis]